MAGSQDMFEAIVMADERWPLGCGGRPGPGGTRCGSEGGWRGRARDAAASPLLIGLSGERHVPSCPSRPASPVRGCLTHLLGLVTASLQGRPFPGFHGEGYQEGYEKGSSLGMIEGRQYGTLHGAKIGSEIGCYQGFAFAWRCLLHGCTTEKDSKKMKVLESLIGMIQKFPYDDPTYDKLHEDLDRIRGKFKQLVQKVPDFHFEDDRRTKTKHQGTDVPMGSGELALLADETITRGPRGVGASLGPLYTPMVIDVIGPRC
ncbi:hypothetical protein E2I00_019574 [Balaenoptera physalus]|uniref:Essential protein Yae1 N-terminal domain-containing protein n=1 Tax=Balaenoptera physalus TaxID=9770 RepID=A0A6A1Q4C9_BALPH|nr:hypothetical protein E2I00_019574 [Balaenoptera physalus]